MRNIRRFATPGTVAELAAREGLISLVFEYGGKAFMAPYGSADPVLSTNPIGIAIPASGEPILLDMATSERAFYFITLAQRLGEEIPSNWALDGEGKPTNDPSKVKAVRPFGSYKGYALAFMLEILTGILVDVDVGLQGALSKRGALAIFMDPSVFGVSRSTFDAKVQLLVRQMKESRVAPGFTEVFIPGEQGQRRKAAALKAGEINLDPQILSELEGLVSS
jgi:ureidoglycolate dehydrogenase (NAD+)